MVETNERYKTSDKSMVKNMISKFGSLLGLLILVIVLTFLSNKFLTLVNIMNILNQSAINILVSFGMLMAILTAGIDLSVGSVLALSTVMMGFAAVRWGLNPVLSIIICLLTGSLLGLLNGLMLTKLHLPHPFISTLGMQNIARGLALTITAASPISGFPQLIQLFGNFWGPIPVSFILVIIVFVLLYIFLNKTASGKYIYAVGGNIEATRLSGIKVDNILVLVYVISGLMSALAGVVLVGRVNAAFPLAGVGYETDAIAACIIGGASFFGGAGTLGGTIIGAFIMAVLRNGLNLLGVSADMQTTAIGLVIIGAVYVDVLRKRAETKR
ncbi:ABC transporter permease [Thermoanaerobacterium thermosaccharolyticum]|uniref:ABC transporter permease n=1 Tax=Thermoanaerobacterium thermosaccharolyticum TaxID=1517 RepID=UPI003DA913EB